MLGRSLGAKNALAPFHVVQIDFQNAPLVQHQLQQLGQYQFLTLAQEIALARKQQVLGQLLGDGGAAIDLGRLSVVALLSFGFSLGVALVSLLDGIPLHTVVFHEASVL